VIRKLDVKAGLSLLLFLSFGGDARAEITLAKPDGWEIYTTGRVGAFVEVLGGDAIPQEYGETTDPATGMPAIDPATGGPALAPVHPVGNGGIGVQSDPVRKPDAACSGAPPCYRQGPVLASRVRSGFLGNILGFGVRRELRKETTVTGFLSLWGTAETDSRRTWFRNQTDWREGYIRIADERAGTLTAGRSLSLFSRGAVEIDFLYGHGFGVGNPAGFDTFGPSGGHIGYGVVAPVFVANVQYATPKLAGFQATIGYFDPGALVGLYWTRTKFGRPEGELAYDAELGSFTKLHLFGTGAWQRMYATDVPRHADVYGAAGGGRIEIGPVHLGVAGHGGRGLGIGYFLDGSDAVVAQFTTQGLRNFWGLYAQGQVVWRQFDFNAGWGTTRVDPLPEDSDPRFNDPATKQPQRSFLKSQTGYSAVVVYHATQHLHFAADYFLSDVRWQLGEKQLVHSFNLGAMLTW
jgi:hypothetical protein